VHIELGLSWDGFLGIYFERGPFNLHCTISAWADCPNGVYEFTEADKKFMTDTAAVLQAAVPLAPEGWSLRDAAGRPIRPGTVWTPPSSNCAGGEQTFSEADEKLQHAGTFRTR